MQFNNLLKSNLYVAGAFGLLLSLTSCGSFQYVGHDSDGIYNDSSDQNIEYVETSNTEDYDENNSSAYYENYFKDKSTQYGNVSEEEDVIFTDIDSYEGSYSDDQYEESDSYDGYAGWGGNNSDIIVNVYNSGWNNWGYGFYRPHWSFGWGYYGYYNPYSVWSPFYHHSYHYGYGYPYYGYGPRHPFYGYYYNGFGPHHGHNSYLSGYYNRRAVAYNYSRRGSSQNLLGTQSRRSTKTRDGSYANRVNSRNTLGSRNSSIQNRSNTLSRRPSSEIRDNSATRRPSTVRPSTSTRKPSVRPGSTSRKPSSVRPSTSIRKPSVRPSSSSRKPKASRPSTSTRKPSFSRPSSSSSNRSYSSPSSSSRSSGSSRSSSRPRRN